MMEAARILKAIGVKPRRTIRVALWSGEEQGLLGSQAYVKEHFGTFEKPKPEFAEVRRLFQHRHRAPAARAALTVFGPPEAADVSARGGRAVRGPRRRRRDRDAQPRAGGTDSTSFNGPGCRASARRQDPIEYRRATWHTNLDTYERIVEDDVKKSAIVIAATPCITWRCATSCCRGSRRRRCRSRMRHSRRPRRNLQRRRGRSRPPRPDDRPHVTASAATCHRANSRFRRFDLVADAAEIADRVLGLGDRPREVIA